MAKSFFSLIEKYNPYHGRDGRFTGAGGATSFSLTGGSNVKRSEMLRTWSNSDRDSAIDSIAKETRFLKNEQYRIIGENGKTLLQSQGEQDNVQTSVGDKREFLGGNTSIHNHPDGGTFSAVDLRDFGFGAKEIIVVSPEGDYSLKNANMGNKKQFDGWLDMQEALKRDVKEASPFELKAKARENLSDSAEKREIDSITSEWVKIKDSNGLESANEWYSGKKDRYDSLVATYNENINKEVRRLEVAPFNEWYKENAPKYGFDYSFTPNDGTPVKKFNDVHDPKTGRFASKGGGMADSSGRTLTTAQSEYFKDSKVRDADGNLMVMYHGTPNGGFEEFRSGTHFTENPEYADNYQSQGASSLGYKKTADNPMTYEVYLDIKKPFDTRNPEEREIFENEYYRKWGMGTPLTGKGLPDWLDAQDLQEFIDEMGYDYDGLILDEGGTGGYGEAVKDRGISYVVFNANQVKAVTNENPTDDGRISKSFLEVIAKFNGVHDPKTGRFAPKNGSSASEVDSELLRLHNAGGRFTASKYAKEHGIDYNEWKKRNGFLSEPKKQTAEEREKLDSQRERLKEMKTQQEKESEKRDYMMAHRPSKFGAGYDLTSEGAMPKDVYDHPEYYFNMREQSSKESMRALKAIRNHPDKEVTIYRASPKNEFNDGDWITLSPTYAKEHAERVGGSVHSKGYGQKTSSLLETM